MSMNHPLAPPSFTYLRFVCRQARILGRRAERSGLHDRARHYRLRRDWAEGLLRGARSLIIGALRQAISDL
jgi:hypothetical protein